MNKWLRRAHLITTLGGGFAGVAIVATAFGNERWISLNSLILGAGLGFYVYGIVVGFRIAEGKGSRTALLWFYGPQIPVTSSYLLTYHFASGAHLYVAVIGGQFFVHWQLGCDFQIRLFANVPLGIGINLFAAIMFALTPRMPSNYRMERP